MPLRLATSKTDFESQSFNAHTYFKAGAVTAGLTVVIPNDTSMVSIRPAGTLGTLNVQLPGFPVDGQTVRIFSTQIITALTLMVATGQTINDAATTIATAMTGVAYCFSANNSTWDRVL
jgi:hypothetical protein